MEGVCCQVRGVLTEGQEGWSSAGEGLGPKGEPTSPPLIHPARGPPQTELQMGHEQAQDDEVVQALPPDDLDQTPDSNPADPEHTVPGDLW